MTPTQRSLAELRRRGFLADIVERRIRRHVTKDLFGFLDIVAWGHGRLLGIQATSRSGGNFAARKAKILNHENYPKVKESPFEIWVWGWGKMASGKWELREELVS